MFAPITYFRKTVRMVDFLRVSHIFIVKYYSGCRTILSSCSCDVWTTVSVSTLASGQVLCQILPANGLLGKEYTADVGASVDGLDSHGETLRSLVVLGIIFYW